MYPEKVFMNAKTNLIEDFNVPKISFIIAISKKSHTECAEFIRILK